MTGLLYLPPYGLLGKAIALVTNNRGKAPSVVHVAVVLGQTGMHYNCIEAWAGDKVKYITYAKSQGIFIPWPMDVNNLKVEAAAAIGKKYDWLSYPALLVKGLLGFFNSNPRWLNKLHAKDSFSCQELAGYLCHRVGNPLPAPILSTPQHVFNKIYKQQSN